MARIRAFRHRLLAWAVVFCAGAAQADEVQYLRDVKPLFMAKCSSCHGRLKQESGLRLDAGQLIVAGGEGGKVLAPGRSAESALVERISTSDLDLRMPPEGEGEALTEAQIGLVRRWIDAGAKFPTNEAIPEKPSEHWAYQPLVRPRRPDGDTGANAIDAFLAERQRSLGIKRAAEAPPHVLLRRVYLDLVGLPPARHELEAFLKDTSPDAYQKVVDRLLESPQYGERWGRHWMDVWRYSDWSGYKEQIRNSQRHIWHWRDWIIRSLNEDKPYDRMIVEMLAADEAAPGDLDALPATGFLARNWNSFNRNAWLENTVEHTAKAFLGMTLECAKCHDHKYDPLAQEQFYQFRAIFETHSIRTDRVPGQMTVDQDGLAVAYDDKLDPPTWLFERGNEKKPDKSRPIAANVPTMFALDYSVEPIELSPEAYYPDLREELVRTTLEAAAKKRRQAAEGLAKAKREADAAAAALTGVEAKVEKKAEELSATQTKVMAAQTALRLAELQLATEEAEQAALHARVAAERAKHGLTDATKQGQHDLALAAGAATAKLSLRRAEEALYKAEQALSAAEGKAKPGDAKAAAVVNKAKQALQSAKKQASDAAAAAEKPTDQYEPLGKQYPQTSSGRRLALARWIVDPKNPLTARVAVNHLWMRHFGAPLVENVFDFGLRSPRPEHAKLLDWLAVELIENGWSMKGLHRLMVTSRTYRLTSSLKDAPPESLAADPDNRAYWRMNSRRLEAEAVRDSVLHVAGSLDLKLGGPDIDQNQAEASRRRSVYLRHAYEKKARFLELFDAANETDCYRRTASVVPQQALALANSQLSLEQSRLLARKLATADQGADSAQADDAFIRMAFESVLVRTPTADELALCREFLKEQSARLADESGLELISGGASVSVAASKDAALRAKENLVHVLMNHNDFVTIR